MTPSAWLVVFPDYAYGPFEDRTVARRIVDQLEDAGEICGDVLELREWRPEWTETICERIRRARRRRIAGEL